MLALLLTGAFQQPTEALRSAQDYHERIYKRLSPAVVGIGCSAPSPRSGAMGGFYGTGAVVSADGLVLTDITVVPRGAKDVKVYFTDGRVREAEIKIIDDRSEGVLVKVNAAGLPFMPLADSKQVRIGDPAYSWGNPYFTIQRDGVVSLSIGSISGLYQVASVDDQSRYLGPAIETDAAVNPGSDGGPLTDAEGNLLGIMSLAFSRTRWLGLAIPADRLRDALPELQELPVAPRPKLIDVKHPVWKRYALMALAAEKLAKATVAIRVVGASEREPPAKRSDEALRPLAAYPDGPPRARMEAKLPIGGYSAGVIIEPAGTVLTSSVVVAREGKIVAYLADGTRVKGSVLGHDESLDVAVVQLEGRTDFDSVKLSPEASKTLVVGAGVAVLGRSEVPGNLTLNSGFVSAVVGRYSNTAAQISALINWGNLGGPVITSKGDLVGIATHLTEKTQWRQNCGVGFTVLADKIAPVLADLKAGKMLAKPKRPFLGVQSDLGAADVKGARINKVLTGTAAEEGGLKAGDIIVQFDGKPIEDWSDLQELIRKSQVGQTIVVKLKRGVRELTLKVTLGEME